MGSKSKHTKATPDDTQVSTLPETNGSSHAGAKRSRDEDDNSSSHKRSKKSKRELRLESPAPRSILSGSQSPTKTPATKKAVSFSAETKAEDGETGQNYFKAWAAGKPMTPPKPSAEILVPETPESTEKTTAITSTESPAEAKAKTKASKRDKKVDQEAAQTQNPNVESMPSLQERRASKAAKKAAKQERKAQEQQQKQPTATAGEAATSPYVEYLHQFHHDKPNWKFNKSKENHLLKNLWSTFRVPATYTDALVSYIAGLQGAGNRTRLVEGADEVLREVTEKAGQTFDFNGYEEPETRREAYRTALNQLRESEDSSKLEQDDFDRAARADAVLTQLLNHAPLPVAVAKPAKAAPRPVAPVGPPVDTVADAMKKVWSEGTGKRITFDDDEDEPAPAPVKPKVSARRRRKARTDVSSDESSSDSSSSDSDSDSD